MINFKEIELTERLLVKLAAGMSSSKHSGKSALTPASFTLNIRIHIMHHKIKKKLPLLK